MSNEFRQDPLTGDWVIIAPSRAKKPENQEKVLFAVHDCPFDDPQASGQETPIAIYAHGKKTDTPEGWTIQVLPNKYPAVTPGQCGPVIEQGLFSVAAGVGAHELVITRDHDRHFANFSQDEMVEVLTVYLERYRALAADDCNKYITIFHNHGPLAGASIHHNHSQILSTPILPPEIAKIVSRAKEHFAAGGTRLTGELVAVELAEQKRIVYQNDSFVALCPFVSRSPYEVNIFPKAPQSDFGKLSDADKAALAEVMREVFMRLDKTLGDPQYTYFIHTAPPGEPDAPFDWHIEIMPRFSPAAGFEFGTGIFINTIDPVAAAEALKNTTI